MNGNRKIRIIFAAAAGAALVLTILLVFVIPGGINRQGMTSSAATAPGSLENLFYVKNGTLYYTSIDTIAPKEIVQYNLPPQWRNVFDIQVSKDGRRFFYPDGIDNTKSNYSADIYCYDVTSKNPERKKIDSGINNYTINQDGSKVFYLKDKALYLSDLSKTKKLAGEIDRFFINKEGDRLVYLTSDGRLFRYTGKNEPKELVSGITLQYVSSDLNMIYYLKDNNLYQLKDGKDIRMIDSGVVSVSNIYADGTLYYLKTNYIKTFDYVNDDMAASDAQMKEPEESDYADRRSYTEACKIYKEKKVRDEIRSALKNDASREIKSLYYYSNGQSAQISKYCDNVWGNEDRMVQTVLNSGACYCGSDRPLLVYSQLTSDKINMSDVTGPADINNHIMNNVIDNVELYVCSGSKTIKEIGDKRPVRVKYDTVNNKIYCAIEQSENQHLYDLYYVTIDGENISEVRKYAEGVNTNDILLGGNIVYIKSVSNSSDGDLYVNNVKIDSYSNIWNWWTNSTNAFTYAGNISRYDYSYTLKLYKDGKVTKLAEHVMSYTCCHYRNKLAYAVQNNKRDTAGQLYFYDGSEASQPVDTGVNAIIAPFETQYYSYWDDQPTYDIE